jgi:hypothetical protein
MRVLACILFIFSLQSSISLNAQTFTDVASIQGVNVSNPPMYKWGTGFSFYDFNQDGWDDLSFAVIGGVQKLYLNNQGNFELVNPSFFNAGETKMLLWVDYDNDGVLDLFLTTKAGGLFLLKNDGNFLFTDVTALSGISIVNAENYGASWGDYDKDGFLDLYVCKYRGFGDPANLNHVNNLYHNNGDGTFSDVSFSSGTSNGITPSYQSIWLDYDHDTWPDLLVVNDRWGFPNALFRNNGDGTFSDIASSSGIAENQNNFMTGTIGDFDNDQDLDVYMTNTATPPPGYFDFPYLFQNDGNGSFANVAANFHLELNKTAWGGLWVDYDNNGWQDLYVATGNVDTSLALASSFLYKNAYPNSFIIQNSIFMNNHVAASHSLGRGDFNNDGFYDILVYNDAPFNSFLWQNSGNQNSYVKLTLHGVTSNTMAIGSWIKVYAQGICYTQYTMCGENYLGQNSQHHIIGVGDANLIDSIHVEYLSGIIDHYYDVQVNEEYHFEEGETSSTFNILGPTNYTICEGDTLVLEAPLFEAYSWNTGDTTRVISLFSEGQYQLTAVNSLGFTMYSNVISVNLSQQEILNIEHGDVSCTGMEDAYILIQNNNLGGQFNVQWQDSLIGDSIYNLGPGLYPFTYTDSFACTYSDSVLITEPYPLNVQSLVVSESWDSLGTIALVINGGVAPYQVYLYSVLVDVEISNLDSGSYFIQIIDAHDCIWANNIEVSFQDSTINTSILEIEDISLSIHPNPFTQELLVNFNATAKELHTISLHDVLGNLVFEDSFVSAVGHNSRDISIDQNYAAGVYLFTITSNHKTHSKMLIKK